MNLLYLFPEPLPLRKARGIQAMNTVDSLARESVDVRLAYVPTQEAADPFIAYGLNQPGGAHLLPLSRGLPWPLQGLRLHSGRFFWRRLSDWLRRIDGSREAPDLAMVRHVKLASQLLDEFPRLPLVYEAHEIFADGAPQAKRPELATLESKVLRQANAVIAISSQLAEHLRQRYGLTREIIVIPSATALPPAPPEKDWRAPGKRIIYAGSLYAWKGVQDLVAAAEWLDNARITIAGGESEAILRLQGVAPVAGATLDFTGHLSHVTVRQKLEQACIAVLPNRAGSVSEFTSPLKLFEYMAAGCALVVSDLPVFREILGPDDAAWFPAGDARRLAEALRSLAADPARAEVMGRRMQELVLNYSWEARAKKLSGLFARLIEQQASQNRL